MSNVTIDIGGRSFTVACAEGEEAHVLRLGRMIGGKLDAMGGAGSQSETRMLLFAALLLADELHEAKAAAAAPLPSPPATLPPGMADRLEAMAARIENLALHLEDRATNT